MEFTFAQIEKVLACTQNIRDERRSAFANRLKNMQKAGFPDGINTGRGRAATYSAGHLILLGLVLELNQLGLNPERAIAVIESDLHAVAMAFSHAAGFGPPEGEFNSPMFLYFDPAGLSELMVETGEDWAVRSFFYVGIGQLKEQLEEWGVGGLHRISLVNVSAVLYDLASYSMVGAGREISDFYEATKVWASPYIHNRPYYASNSQA